ncbi:thermosome subunit beta [Candidatus Nitrososphaera gargensis]|uniref:thermosome subunit beta n=1 Tax=Candidatus Nitrososphaera gargensis TaxID=497727 RepID=UPI0011E571E3
MSTLSVAGTTKEGIPILLLKEGTSQTKGRDAIRNNVEAAKLVAAILKPVLGPRGMDKMLVDSLGDVTITNDGATILKEMDVQHPAAKIMVEIAKTVDEEVGDGTTSSVIIAGAMLEKAEELLIKKGIHPTIIVDGYRKAMRMSIEILNKIAEDVNINDHAVLKDIAKTSMESKIVSVDSDVLADLAVKAILTVAEKADGANGDNYMVADLDNVKVQKKAGESMGESSLIEGIIVDKEITHSEMPKRIENARILLLNSGLEIEKTEFDAKISIDRPEQMKMFLEEETRMIKAMVDKIAAVKANVVFCQKGIDDIGLHYLTKANISAVRRVKESDLDALAKATGARVVTNIDDLSPDDLGYAQLVEEKKVELDKWVFVEKCRNPKAVSVLIRGGSQRIVDEAERSIHDALMVVKDVVQKPAIVVGGGSPEAYVAQRLREWAPSVSGREHFAILAFADAIESIPVTLIENAGMDTIDTITQIRSKQSATSLWMGVDVKEMKVTDMRKKNVIEPLAVKEQVLKSATEAAAMLLRIDDILAASPTPAAGQSSTK